MRILAMVNVKDVPDSRLALASGLDLCHFIEKMIGVVSPRELIKESDTIEVDFGVMGVRMISRVKAKIFADLTEE
jgi:hypothetical protein